VDGAQAVLVRRRAVVSALLVLSLAGVAASEPPAAKPPPAVDAAPLGPSVDQRLAEIARRIQRASRYPAIARERGVSGEALVGFEVGGDGRPSRLKLVVSSGSGALDRAALDAVERAAPLPFVYGRVTAPVRFSLSRDDELE
jgi:protein TonB